jgi:DNA-directed RNA polymerase subunit RPC12/RpoP
MSSEKKFKTDHTEGTCPACGSKDLEYDFEDSGDKHTWRYYNCTVCRAEVTQTYDHEYTHSDAEYFEEDLPPQPIPEHPDQLKLFPKEEKK